MKKVVFLMAAALVANMAMAQKTDRTNAYMYNKNGQFDKAVESIEKCVNHEQFLGMKLKDQAQAWLYRGMIYLNVHQDPALAANYPDALEKAYESLNKCVTTDPAFAKDNAQDIYPRVANIMVQYFQAGVNGFNNQDYPTAAVNFRKSYEVSLSGAAPDTMALINAALAYQRGNMFNDAISSYIDLQNLGYNQVDLYKNMAACYNGLNDEAKALEMIQTGLEKFPNDPSMIIEKVNIFLKQGKGEEAINDLVQLQAMDPSNASILFILGTLYGDDKSDIYNSDKAIEYYMEAINVNPNYIDAAYNLGALYINMSNKLKAEANEITGFSAAEIARYDELVGQAEELVRTGLPFVKQAYDAAPSPEIKQVLKSMYVNLKMNDEAKALDEE